MAARMVQQGSIAETPEQLDLWISEHPEVAQPLREGGYGRAFDAGDLFPLLEVFLAQAGAPAVRAEAPSHSPNRNRLVAAVFALLLIGAALAVIALR
jgi:hypothetical protein